MTSTNPNPSSRFESAPYIPPDRIFELTAQYLSDPASPKVNLGQGTYCDSNGQPWILPAVAAARDRLAATGLNHEYLPILGHPVFRTLAPRLALGSALHATLSSQIATCQALSGTGSLHLAGVLLRYLQSQTSPTSPLPKVYIPTPTWSNHHQIFTSLGFEVATLPYYSATTRSLALEPYLATLAAAEPNSVVILHACAHNPSGCDPSLAEWRQIAQTVKDRHLFPLFDAAYLGFNSGDLDQDAAAIRLFAGEEFGLEIGVCMSFAKNMGLYGERTGCFFLTTHQETTARNTESVLEVLQRREVSNPPAYGAKIAALILGDEGLTEIWKEDLRTMSGRIREMRERLVEGLVQFGAPGDWEHLVRQTGMFGFLGLDEEVVKELREEDHIYMADNSRVSIAGLNPGNVEYVAKAIAERLRKRNA
ncbi:aspartate aminotransferase/Glutamic oxaloacetic transaminase AAT2/GOT1 [Aspergillus saccharolyticus JOP 1030-1]|uniref:aspartate transaminase n=1 Tax=Aspergillus saccharolyticus JOP 1030-1 TaxID=1450539 RepID=A0A319AQE8_9EURO|nr:aspartate aminotransferase/Glutamic oxaloacetic transaminase AAT2/GOT1 [Aspergillus saccharolyticus JOP 1030-1]PYH48632.1 aspartate aminotransferase/Glutamic oxaloacetic transaminase AAT2/GOT1 [Aspergillus saccharolyticus JOP 1030-1]